MLESLKKFPTWAQVVLAFAVLSMAVYGIGRAVGYNPDAKKTSHSQHTVEHSTPSARPAPAASSAPTNLSAAATTPKPTAGGKVSALTAFGATLTDWNSHRRANNEFAPGSVYDRDPSLPDINGHTGSRYVTVQVTAGRVLNYQRNFPAHTPTAGGIALARQELPADAVVVWQQQKGTCYQLEYRSAVLGQALADPRIGDPAGTVMVELSSDPDSSGMEVYVPSNVAYALLMMDQSATAADAPGC